MTTNTRSSLHCTYAYSTILQFTNVSESHCVSQFTFSFFLWAVSINWFTVYIWPLGCHGCACRNNRLRQPLSDWDRWPFFYANGLGYVSQTFFIQEFALGGPCPGCLPFRPLPFPLPFPSSLLSPSFPSPSSPFLSLFSPPLLSFPSP